MKSTLTYDEIIEKAVTYKTFYVNRNQIEIKFCNVLDEYKEPMCIFIKTALENNGTLNFLCSIFNKVSIPMFSLNNFIAQNTRNGAVFIVYGEKE